MAGNNRSILGTFFIAAAIAVGLFVRHLPAQSEGDEATITGFSLPEVDDKGELKWKVRGEQAKMKPTGPMDISGLRVEWFKSNEVDMVLTSPQCLYNRERREAETEAPVRIQSRDTLITGDGFYWSGTNNLLVIRKNVHTYLAHSGAFTKPQTNDVVTSRSAEEKHK